MTEQANPRYPLTMTTTDDQARIAPYLEQAKRARALCQDIEVMIDAEVRRLQRLAGSKRRPASVLSLVERKLFLARDLLTHSPDVDGRGDRRFADAQAAAMDRASHLVGEDLTAELTPNLDNGSPVVDPLHADGCRDQGDDANARVQHRPDSMEHRFVFVDDLLDALAQDPDDS